MRVAKRIDIRYCWILILADNTPRIVLKDGLRAVPLYSVSLINGYVGLLCAWRSTRTVGKRVRLVKPELSLRQLVVEFSHSG